MLMLYWTKDPYWTKKDAHLIPPSFFFFFFLAFREYTKNINYKLNCVYATKNVFKLIIITHMSMWP